jgi:hypothetical protein
MRPARFIAAVLLTSSTLLVALAPAARAQTTIGPGGIPIAPGPSQPNYVPGGIGPGGTPVAPGPAARGVIQEIGPGGIPIAPGPAGRIQHQRRARIAPLPPVGSDTIGTTIITDEKGNTHVGRRDYGLRRHSRVSRRGHRNHLPTILRD